VFARQKPELQTVDKYIMRYDCFNSNLSLVSSKLYSLQIEVIESYYDNNTDQWHNFVVGARRKDNARLPPVLDFCTASVRLELLR